MGMAGEDGLRVGWGEDGVGMGWGGVGWGGVGWGLGMTCGGVRYTCTKGLCDLFLRTAPTCRE